MGGLVLGVVGLAEDDPRVPEQGRLADPARRRQAEAPVPNSSGRPGGGRTRGDDGDARSAARVATALAFRNATGNWRPQASLHPSHAQGVLVAR